MLFRDRTIYKGKKTVVSEVKPNTYTFYQIDYGTLKQCRKHRDCTYNSEISECFRCKNQFNQAYISQKRG